MVSIALFAVVMTASIGSILTITDSNKKARSLMSVMTNLNFATDSIIRSFKTGEVDGISNPVNGSGGESITCLTANEIDYVEVASGGEAFSKREVKYCFVPRSGDTPGKITKQVTGDTSATPITPPDVDITYLVFDVTGYDEGNQPMLTLTMEGVVKVTPLISSNFSIQASASQRKLNR